MADRVYLRLAVTIMFGKIAARGLQPKQLLTFT
jgi:hypothetical protein